MVFAGKQVNAHDAENQPEDETHQQHIHDGGDGAHQGIHHHLHWKGRPLSAAGQWKEHILLVSRRGMTFVLLVLLWKHYVLFDIRATGQIHK